jgi:hypothetical protein
MSDRYQHLLDLTRKQRTLIEDGDLDGAAGLSAVWQQLVEGLPARPPEDARNLLEEAASIAWSNTAVLEALAAEVTRELAHLGRGRRALASYAAPDGVSLETRV